ncbi:MAG: hypothetical protein MSH10_00410 [Pygmaiobacter massiliensis]|nr:hypothetical protein [Pygmaiobacter massiliensis]
MWNLTLFGFTFYQLFWYFCLYSMLGWCTEVIYCTLNTGKLVNRGFLYGPVCPIYGFGMLIILCVLTPLRQHFLPLLVGGALLASALELITGWALEKLFHTRWWDYSDQPFNLGGYICLKFSILWGFGCVLAMRVLHPLVAGLVGLMPQQAGQVLAWPVLIVYLTDLVLTVVNVTRMDRDLGELEKLAQALHRQSEALSHTLGSTALELSDRLEDSGIPDRLEDARSELADRMDEAREMFSDAKEEFADRMDKAKERFADARDELADRAWNAIEDYHAADSSDQRPSAKERFVDQAVEVKERISQAHAAALARQAQLQQRYDALLSRRRPAAERRLSRAFPKMRRTQGDSQALHDFLQQLHKK